MRRNGLITIRSRKYLLLNGNLFGYISKDNKNDRTLVFDLIHNKGELTFSITNLETKEEQSIEEPTSNRYFFHIDKGCRYQYKIIAKKAHGSYYIGISKKDIKVTLLNNLSILNEMNVFYVSSTKLVSNSGQNSTSFMKYEDKYRLLFKMIKSNKEKYIIVLQELLNKNELRYLLEKIYKKSNKDISIGVYDDSFVKEYSGMVEDYHLDISDFPIAEGLKPFRPFVVH